MLGKKQAAQYQKKAACIFLEDGECASRSISYEELDLKAQGLAACLQKMCTPGDRVLLAYESSIDYMIAFLGACTGVIAVPICPPRREPQKCAP